MVIAIVGAVDQLRQPRRWQGLDEWENPDQPHPAPRCAAERPRAGDDPRQSQADIVIGPGRPPLARLPGRPENSVIGQFGMMGRIGEAVREKAGLAYSAPAAWARLWPGPWAYLPA
jgi:zinc protease